MGVLHHFALKMRNGNVTFHSFTPTKWAFLMRKGVNEKMRKILIIKFKKLV
jgi:hypothetical protein